MKHYIQVSLTVFIVLLFTTKLSAQTPTRDSLAGPGPYQVAYYSSFPAVQEFGSATIYFPANKGQTFGAVAIAPGYTEKKGNINWWGNHLASHGYAVLVMDTNEPGDFPEVRAEALMAAIRVLVGENLRMGSPIKGKIDEDRFAIMGHSMGGGGALLAANSHTDKLKAAIPFTPWLPESNFSEVRIPTLIIAGEIDRIAVPNEHSWPHYQSLPNDIPKMYFELKGGNHFIANTNTNEERLQPNIDVHDLLGSIGVAWLKLFVDEDEAYRSLVFGEMKGSDKEKLSRWVFEE